MYTPSQENQEKEINHDVLFREGQNRLKQTTFTPRMVAFDLKGSLNTLKQEGTLYEVAGQENIKWLGDVTMHAEDAAPKNRFLAALEGEGHSKSDEDVDEKDRIEREIEELNDPENESERQTFGPKLYDLDSSVNVWSDYLRTQYHPKSVHIVEDYRHNTELHPFDLFPCGNQVLGNYSATCDWEDRIHYFTEECDSLQGFHVFLDTHNGFGGLGSGLLKYFEEEFPGKGILTFGFTPADLPDDTPQSRSTRIINSALAYDAASSHSSLFVPTCLATGLWRVKEPLIEFPNLSYKSMAYHTSAILASAIDTASVPYRLETNPCVLADITHSFNAQSRKMAAICSSLPFPISPENSLVDVLTEHEIKFPWQSLTPHFKSDTLPIMQSVVLRGIPQNHVTSRQSPGRLSRFLTGLSTADAIMEAYLSNVFPGKLFSKSVITSPLKTSIPYPHVFDRNVTKDGLLGAWKRPINQGVESVPLMTSLQCNTGVGEVIEHLHSAAVKMNIRKHCKYIEMGLEEDEYLEVVDNLHTLSGNYYTESEGL